MTLALPKEIPLPKIEAQMASALGICTKTLYRLRDRGCFKPGRHYLIVSATSAARPTYRWHLERCEKAMGISLERR